MVFVTDSSFIQVIIVLDPCDDNNANSGYDGMPVENESCQDDDFSYTEVKIKQIMR